MRGRFTEEARVKFPGSHIISIEQFERGDIETVKRHLRELKRVPFAQEVYRALVTSALRDLPGKSKKELLALLTR